MVASPSKRRNTGASQQHQSNQATFDMNSTKSPPAQLPFGYAFQDSHQIPYPSPPAPAPGPALLDDSESHMLDSFFDTLGSSGFEGSDFFLERPFLDKTGEPLNSSWFNELPPTFHGTTTSLQQPLATPAYANNDHLNFLQDNSHNDTSADVLAAASTLFNNGQATQTDESSNQSLFPPHAVDAIFRGAREDFSSSRRASVPVYQKDSTGSMPKYSPVPRQSQNLPPGIPQTRHGSISYNRNHAGPSSSSLYNAHMTKTGELRWGSDVSFLAHGYVAPPNQETEEEVTKDLMHKMECLEPQMSANSTAPPSPSLQRQKTKQEDNFTAKTRPKPSQEAGVDVEEGPKAKKRRKSKAKIEDRGDQESVTVAKSKKGKSVANESRVQNPKPPAMSASPERRESPTNGQKQPRENLSEEQKRSNHILSEQKRRNLIKQGFEDLCELVPELNGGGFSKSAMLVQAADWLENMLKGNEMLKSQLTALEGRARR
ncbi:hypothetical protein L228DRAFT_250426 [Xylona heveae TC161]|uniref:BHLH domain-containing protein n=1 Tax=Xylona heveae (strain CBS 132557 / TC161) TaxID=1328760 RepID=A0A165A669_XYLHT|nr:hypothetical protein L228DRAFT_250426 [Xylona heveae TC161]KZF20006.1 hypothetical protein L228DRAFT_250426 [Xylona heveae TC161]